MYLCYPKRYQAIGSQAITVSNTELTRDHVVKFLSSRIPFPLPIVIYTLFAIYIYIIILKVRSHRNSYTFIIV